MQNKHIKNFIERLLEDNGFVYKELPATGDLYYCFKEERGTIDLVLGFKGDGSIPCSWKQKLSELTLVNLLSGIEMYQGDFIKHNQIDTE